VIATSVALVLALAAEPAGQTTQRYASLAVEAEIEGETGEVVRQRITERGDIALRSAAVLPARDDGDATITVVVREDPEASSYVFEVRTARAGKADAAPVTGDCRLCTEGELVAAIERELGEVIAALEPPPAPPPIALRESSAATHVDAPRRTRLGKQGIAGVSLLVAGTVAIATGIGLVVAPDRDAADPRYDVTTRPAGWAVLGTGAAIATVGAVLLGLDRRPQSRRARMALGGGRGHASVGVRFRF
jgi:hypothetical protein